MTRVAIVHDYLTQRGGAERVVLAMLDAFPDAPLYTSLFDPRATFAEFGDVDVRPTVLNRVGLLRHHHRLALPLLPFAFARLQPPADIVLCSSSGWAHGTRSKAPKVVYCYAPARWLYQRDRYLRDQPAAGALALRVLAPLLRRWDAAAAASATTYVTSSHAMRAAIRAAYGRDAEVLAPPQTLDPAAPQRAVAGIEPGFVLCVSRLLPYKNVDAVVEAFATLPDERLVVVGTGPDEQRLRTIAPSNVHFAGRVEDEELRWLYANSRALVAASHEDFGLTPLEAAAFGKPSATLRYGGFLDTIVPGETGVFFDAAKPDDIATALRELFANEWDAERLERHASGYSQKAFADQLRGIVSAAAGAA